MVGTGPWTFHGSAIGTLYFLSNNVAHLANTDTYGVWTADEDGRHLTLRTLRSDGLPSSIASRLIPNGLVPNGLVPSRGPNTFRLRADCWKLTTVATPEVSASLVWQHPASRCFPTCSDQTHDLTGRELQISALAARVVKHQWTWAGIPGLRFTFDEAGGGGVLITPWGHGTWGITPSRADVLVALFAQKRCEG